MAKNKSVCQKNLHCVHHQTDSIDGGVSRAPLPVYHHHHGVVRDVPQVDVHVHDQEGGGAGGGLLYKLSQVKGILGGESIA